MTREQISALTRPTGRRFTLSLLAAAAVALLAALALPAITARSALTFTVNSTLDEGDANTGDGVCETASPGVCTLRAAIQQANSTGGTDTINFAIG